MAKPTVKFRPLADQGVDFSSPQYARKWFKLNNTYPDGGRIRTRPGLRLYGPYEHSASRLAAGVPTALFEVDSNIETLSIQRLAPNATTSAGTWTIVGAATVHEALDDDPPDDQTTFIHTTTDDDAIVVGFGNFSNAPDIVSGLVIGGRARNDTTGGSNMTLTLYSRDALAQDVEIGQVTIYQDEQAETDEWTDFVVGVERSPHTGEQWTSTEINALLIKVERSNSSQDAFNVLVPDANGNHTDWSASATAHDSLDDSIVDLKDGAIGTDAVSTNTAGKQSVTFPSVDSAYTSIDKVTAYISLDMDNGLGYANVRPFFYGSDATVYYIDSVKRIYRSIDNNIPGFPFHMVTVEMTTNPQTGSAWTESEVNAAEFGVEFIDGTGTVNWRSISLIVEGQVGNARTELTSLYADAFGLESGGRDIKRQVIVADGNIQATQTRGTAGLEALDANVTWKGIPPLKSQYALLDGKVYVTNAINQIVWYPDASDVFDQFTSLPYGATIESFGGRLILGDVTESAARNKERLRWNEIGDPDDFAAALAGDLDVHDTPGAWVKLKKMLGSLIGYKEKGIYEVVQTPEVIQPFRHFIRDPETGCVAGETVQSAVSAQGQVVHLFLGDGPNGLTVYQFDGNAAVPIGGAIEDEIRRTINQETKQYSFAVVDPKTKMYLLFIPETDEDFYPDQCWAYHLPTQSWRKWTFGLRVAAAGVWTIQKDYNDDDPVFYGDKRAVLGATDGFPYYLDTDKWNDDIGVGVYNPDSPELYEVDSDDTGNDPPPSAAIDVQIASGDLFEPEAAAKVSAARVHIWYRDRGPVFIDLQKSVDGGENYTTERSEVLGYDNSGKLRYAELGINDINTNRFSFQIRANTNLGPELQELDLEDLMVELDIGGEGV